jgi:hypothetical protein
MPEPAAPFALDPGTAALALLPAASAARNAVGLRMDSPGKHLRLARSGAPAGESSDRDGSGAAAPAERVGGPFVAEHRSPGASASVRHVAGAAWPSGS